MAKNQNESPSPESSLNFLSTQIQSRYEVQEKRDSDIAKLQRFHNSPIQIKPNLVTKKSRISKRKLTKNVQKKITLLSAFVRDLLTQKKPLNTHSILDYFQGEKGRADEFISLLESLTAPPFSLSSITSDLALFTGEEWHIILDTLRLKFPNLSAPKKKSLKLITKRLEAIREQEASQGIQEADKLQKLWSQASNQPNEDLTTEDLKWLYDLDEEQLLQNTSMDIQEDSSQQPFSFTLSQMLRDLSQQGNGPSSSPVLENECTIENSEPEVEPFSQLEIEELLKYDIILDNHESQQSNQSPQASRNKLEFVSNKSDTKDSRYIYSSQSVVEQPIEPSNTMKMPSTTVAPRQQISTLDSIDIVTSISFAPTEETRFTEKNSTQQCIRSSSVIEIDSPSIKRVNSSPIRSPTIKTSQDWPSDPIIESSQAQPRKEADSFNNDSQGSNYGIIMDSIGRPSSGNQPISPSKPPKTSLDILSYTEREDWVYERVECLGQIDFKELDDPNLSLKKIPFTIPDDVVPDSEGEDDGITIVEVAYLNKPGKELVVTDSVLQDSVLQVVSSP